MCSSVFFIYRQIDVLQMVLNLIYVSGLSKMEYIFYLFCFCVLYVIVANFLFLRHFSRKDLQIKAEYFDGMINLYIKK